MSRELPKRPRWPSEGYSLAVSWGHHKYLLGTEYESLEAAKTAARRTMEAATKTWLGNNRRGAKPRVVVLHIAEVLDV